MNFLGPNLEPIQDSYLMVFKLACPPSDFEENGEVLAVHLESAFILSTKDKESVPPHLSVWIESLTTYQQAYSFLSENSNLTLVLRLNVDKIRKINISFGEIDYSNLLNVIWVYIFQDINSQQVPDSRPGAIGHAGIIGLDDKSAPTHLSKKQKQAFRKRLRVELAKLASHDCFLI